LASPSFAGDASDERRKSDVTPLENIRDAIVYPPLQKLMWRHSSKCSPDMATRPMTALPAIAMTNLSKEIDGHVKKPG
ncbi:hypothetical protein AB9F41_37015, partial [Rhizobium leguminosarum]|uniref:hypothetical protein n=1 Tax=Rhizobium leguminosarum TaxID=384 RepID=UPI003F9D85F0